MAERRMFSKKIIDTDQFLDMPMSTRLLYYDLNMRADDDGFVDSPKKITKMIGCSDDDLKMLVAKQFVIPFNTGICVIRHWRIHNYIQKDRYHETSYIQEKSQLSVSKNGAYETMDTECVQDGHEMDTQVRLGKVRLELGKDNTPLPPMGKKPKSEESFFNCAGILDNADLTGEEKAKLEQWLQHKRERKDKYTETGFKSLLTVYRGKIKEFGRAAVFSAIDQSMAGGYAGIVWDKLKNANYGQATPQKKNYDYSGDDTL